MPVPGALSLGDLYSETGNTPRLGICIWRLSSREIHRRVWDTRYLNRLLNT